MSDDIFLEFVTESEDNLELFEKKMLALEDEPENLSLINEIFRAVHTIKGTAGFFGFEKIQTLGHAAENVLGALRDKKLRASPSITSVLLKSGDMLRSFLDFIKSSGDEGNIDPAQLIEELKSILTKPSDETTEATLPQSAAPPIISPPQVAASQPISPAQVAVPAQVAAPPPIAKKSAAKAVSTDSSEFEHSMELPIAKKPEERESIRIDVSILEGLMDLVGEMVLTRNQMMAAAASYEDTALFPFIQRMGVLTSELQEGITKTRMQPISNVWQKLPRVVRDLALSCGKQVEVVMEGQDTELDKAVLEAIKDPLTHIVRNAVDHGIELPAARLAKGKPSGGTLLLKAYHQSSKVHIVITDDGGGIPVDKIKQKALDKKIVTPEDAAKLSKQEILQLIFLPGFSTAEKVTNISGRGVGMDVVRSNIEKIGGTVEIQSEPGAGSSFIIKIPLTLAIIPALLVSACGQSFAIPQSHVCELVKPSPEELREELFKSPVYRLRGGLLPLVSLQKQLNKHSESTPESIIVLQTEKGQFGLLVDRIIDSAEIVVKPFSQQLKNIGLYSGAAILGDGEIALILDTQTLAPSKCLAPASEEEEEVTQQSLLLIKSGAQRLAFPMEMISRLERIPSDSLEGDPGDVSIQYREKILPIARLATLLSQTPSEESDVVDLLVLERPEGSIGVIVEQIMDVVDGEFPLLRRSNRFGIKGSAIVQERITEIIDAETIFVSVNN